MSMILLLVLIVGVVLSFVAGLWFLVVSFRQSIVWGLACLFVPFASIVFLIMHWQEAKKPFLLSLLGAVLLIYPAMKMGPSLDADGPAFGPTRTASGRSMPATARSWPTPTSSRFARSTPVDAAPLAAGAATPATTPDLLADWPRPTPPPGILPPPPPPETPTHDVVKVADLGRHVGNVLRFRLKDGRTIVGTVRTVDAESVRVERNLGLGTSTFALRLVDIEDALVRR